MKPYLILAMALLVGCSRKTPPAPTRVLFVRAVADADVRRRPNWTAVVASRLRKVAQTYAAFHIAFEPIEGAEWDPDPQATPEEKRRSLGSTGNDGAWIYLGFAAPPPREPGPGRRFTGEPDPDEPGHAVPFDPRILVYDYTSRSESENAANLAHELAHVFGAWHSADTHSLMHLPPGEDFDSTAAVSIRLTRMFDTQVGIAGISPAVLKQVQNLWAKSGREPASNPVFQGYAAAGYEQLSQGRLKEAVDPLSMAAATEPKQPGPHRALAATYLLLKRYPAAAGEFRILTGIAPPSGAALNGLARALAGTGEFEAAVAALREAGRLYPESATLHANLGIVLAHTPGGLEEAVSELQRALELDPRDEGARSALEQALAARALGGK